MRMPSSSSRAKKAGTRTTPTSSRTRCRVYTPTKDDDPKKGTVDEERRGPFPIGVAAEISLPADWYSPGEDKSHKSRVAVIGSGNVFVGQSLSPLKEKMSPRRRQLADGTRRLAGQGRGDPWQYPRCRMAHHGALSLAMVRCRVPLAPPFLFLLTSASSSWDPVSAACA